MAEILTILVVVTMLATIIAVVGHGLWLLAGAMFRICFHRDRPPTSESGRCPACTHPTGLVDGLCHVCGHQTNAAIHRDLAATRRQIDRLWQSGRMSGDIRRSLLEAIASAFPAPSSAFEPGLQPGPTTTAQQPTAPPTPQASITEPNIPGEPDIPSSATSHPEQPTARTPEAHDPLSEADTPPVDQPLGSPFPDTSYEPVIEAELLPEQDPLFGPDALDQPSRAEAFSPRRTLADMLQAFMEEKNIRWGELASGLLIVGSAIGLVISLRATLQQLAEAVPYFPALMLMLGTAAIHGVGLYTLRRWHLRSTSRGVLVIATLLVPLSFAAGIVLSGAGPQQVPITSPWYLGAVLIGILGYATITAYSAQALSPAGWWRIVVAVMGTSIGQLLINRLSSSDIPGPSVAILPLLLGLPLASYLIATAGQLMVIARRDRLTPSRAGQTFLVLGISLFSLAVPFGMLLWAQDDARSAITALAPAFSIVAAMVSGLGISMHRRCTSQVMSATRTIGTTLAIFGGLALAAAFLLAWPDPMMLVIVGFVTAAILIVLGAVGHLPLLYSGAIGSLSLACLVAFHWLQGRFDPVADTTGHHMVAALLMGRSAAATWLLSLLVGGLAACLARQKRLAEAAVVASTAAALTIASLAIALYAGFWSGTDGDWTTPLFVVYFFAALSVTITWQRLSLEHLTQEIHAGISSWVRPFESWDPGRFSQRMQACFGWLACGLLAVSLIHLLGWNNWFRNQLALHQMALNRPLLVAILAHGLLVELIGISFWLRPRRRSVTDGLPEPMAAESQSLLRPFGVSGTISAALAVPASLLVIDQRFVHHTGYLAVITVTWLLASCVTRTTRLRLLSHIAATVTVGFLSAAIAQRMAWSETLLRDLRHWQLQLTLLSLWCAGTAAFRLAMRRGPGTSDRLAASQTQATEAVLLSLLVVGLLTMGMIGCWPGILVETGSITTASELAQDTWHTVAYGPGSWIAWACLLTALMVAIADRPSPTRWSGLCLATMGAALFLAGRFESQQAVASALRWSAAGLSWLWMAFLALDQPLVRHVKRSGWLPKDYQLPGLFAVRDLAVLAGLLPVVALTSWTVTQLINQASLGGPASESLFGGMPPLASHGVPIGLMIAGLLIGAVRDRRPSLALVGMLLVQYLVALGVVLPLLINRERWSLAHTVTLLQWSAIGWAAYSWLWLLLHRWIEPADQPRASWQLQLQIGLSTSLGLALVSWAFLWIILEPNVVHPVAVTLGRWPSYLAVLLGLTAIAWLARQHERLHLQLAVAGLAALATLSSATAILGNVSHPWLSYHTLTTSWFLLGLVITGMACWLSCHGPRDWQIPILARWGTTMALVLALVIGRGCAADPWNPWWTLAACGGLTGLVTAWGILLRSQRHAYATLPIVLFAATFAFMDFSSRAVLPGLPATTPGQILTLFYWNVIAGTAAAVGWLLVEVWFQTDRHDSLAPRSKLPAVHAVVAGITVASMFIIVLGGAIATTVSRLPARTLLDQNVNWWGYAAMSGLGALLVATLWDARSVRVGLALYCWGLIAIAMILHTLEDTGLLTADDTVVAGCLALAAYLALTGHLWKWGANLARLAIQLRIPNSRQKLESISYWLLPCNLLGTLCICLLGFAIVFLAEERGMRMSTAFAPLLAAYGVSCFAQAQRKQPIQCTALLVGSLSTVFIGWADIDVTTSSHLTLLFAARLLIVLAGLTLLFGVVVARWLRPGHHWYQAVRQTATILAGSALIALVALMTLEVMEFQPGAGIGLGTAEVLVISSMLVGLVIALLTMAVLPGVDPWSLSETQRGGYVYAAQAVATLLFAHLYLSRPDLFDTSLRPYWPYFVMLLAFASVTVGEICHRQGWSVIAGPLQRTGGFLPLLPAVGTWIVASQTDYSLLLFFAGLVYVFLSIARRSFVASLAAAVAGNGAFWALLYENDYILRAVPQLWLIPPAASILLAAQINRDRLDQRSLTAIRYISIMIIYLSSAGEMFMTMLAPEGPGGMLRPVILASLSVAGLMLGIMFRVRAFLYLGTSFLLLSVFAMVWQAARLLDHTWPWWTFGISLGLLILIFFGIFEKHRTQVQQLVERLRQWQP